MGPDSDTAVGNDEFNVTLMNQTSEGRVVVSEERVK
jgi:hypothetical protein